MDAVYSVQELTRTLDPVFREHGVRSAVLFGSYAKGCANGSSDVDILVDSGLHGLRFFGLLESVSSALRVPVDLLDTRQIEPGSQIEREIQASGVQIYGE